jgi:DUF1365 family protein
MPKNAVFTGFVYHKRFKPFEHEFRYPTLTFFCRWDDTSQTKLFSRNKFNVYSLHDKDHGKRDGSSVTEWIKKESLNRGLDISNGSIYFLGYPRILGFVFNPISIFFLYDDQEILRAILYEVKNTFGDQHSYFKILDDAKLPHSAIKNLHVSPFISLDCEYNFAWKTLPDNDTFDFTIRQTEQSEFMFVANWNGTRTKFDDQNMLKQCFNYPFLTLGVVLAIHWQALKIWIKGGKYHPIPKPPVDDFS